MPNILRQRDIIDRRALAQALAQAVADAPAPALDRAVLLPPLRAALAKGRAEIYRRFEADGTAVRSVREQSFLIDQLIRVLYDFVSGTIYPIANPTEGEKMAIVAVGGYGRGEMAPYSDIDLLFLLPYKLTPHTEQVVEFLLYMLWDLGLKVGQSTRSVADCMRYAKADLTIRTALLEARYVWGEQALYSDLKQRFEAEILRGTAAQFVEAKLAERDARHQRVGDSRYQLEPNIKEGKGGLRDLHTLYWIGKYIYRIDDVAKLVELGVLSAEESARFERAQSFLWTVRCHLHYIAGRAEERLTFDLQTEIGARMGYTDRAGARGVERFMKHYFLVAKDVGDLTRIFCAILEADQQPKRRRPSWLRWGSGRRALEGFALDRQRLTIPSEDFFKKDPVGLHSPVSCRTGARARHPSAGLAGGHPIAAPDRRAAARRPRGQPPVPRNPDLEEGPGNRPATDERGRRVRPLHSRFRPRRRADAVRHVPCLHGRRAHAVRDRHPAQDRDGRAEGRISGRSEIMPTIASRRALYLAALLHDIAKGRGGDHSILGEKVALKVGPRLGLSAEETETVAWLVRWHLLMSGTAFKLDISEPHTIQNFVERVQSPERLKLLLVLTTADIRAVGPKVWNGWKAALLRELYNSTLDTISGGLTVEARDSRIAAAQAKVRALLPDFSEEEFAAFTGRGYPFYWLSLDAETHARHARLMREAEASGAPLTVEKRVDPDRAVTEITLYTADHPGLFSRIAGALAVSGANIVDAKIMTMTNGMALDTLWVQDQDGTPFDRPDKLAKLAFVFENVLTGKLKPHIELERPPAIASRTSVFTVPPRVLIDNQASRSHTVVEVNGRDRPGLLWEVTRELTRLNLQVSSAKISTYGEKVVDVFYVKNLFGHKVEHPQKLAEIRTALEAVLAKGNVAAPPAPVLAARPRRARARAAAE